MSMVRVRLYHSVYVGGECNWLVPGPSTPFTTLCTLFSRGGGGHVSTSIFSSPSSTDRTGTGADPLFWGRPPRTAGRSISTSILSLEGGGGEGQDPTFLPSLLLFSPACLELCKHCFLACVWPPCLPSDTSGSVECWYSPSPGDHPAHKDVPDLTYHLLMADF